MFESYICSSTLKHIYAGSVSVPGVPQLRLTPLATGVTTASSHRRSRYETPEALQFTCKVFEAIRPALERLLISRGKDRHVVDEFTRSCVSRNNGVDYEAKAYCTSIGVKDTTNRVVFGPKEGAVFAKAAGPQIAPVPGYLQGPHVTLFGPPDTKQCSVAAMNCAHCRLPGEPPIVTFLAAQAMQKYSAKWGADTEDSKTPIHEDLVDAGANLKECFERTIEFNEVHRGGGDTTIPYRLLSSDLALPIKRIPGLAMPSTFALYNNDWDHSGVSGAVPLPLHVWDFGLHIFNCAGTAEALSIYIPKLENEEEAAYVQLLIRTAEELLVASGRFPQLSVGTVRVMIVFENARAIFRINEIITALHPYFAGGSLGWHDFLASTARMFKEDPQYRVPVKADPSIVVRNIKASHILLATVVGGRGGICVGGMYGILPTTTELHSTSFQVTLKGYFIDLLTQMKRGLTGFWVAHPDFVRLGLAIVEAWTEYQKGTRDLLEQLVQAILQDPAAQSAVLKCAFEAEDTVDVDDDTPSSSLYLRSLLAANIKTSTFIANDHPDEIRFNCFQCLQYLADWLCGNGCVALPHSIGGVPVRVMDDLATTERSRWEVWHMVRHGFVSKEKVLRIAEEEIGFIRENRSTGSKQVEVKWSSKTAKWYPVAFNIMVQLMTDVESPVEFAPELLLPFLLPSVRHSDDPWKAASELSPMKFRHPSSLYPSSHVKTL